MRGLWETVAVYGSMAMAAGLTMLHIASSMAAPSHAPAQWLDRECFATDDFTSVYSRYVCHYAWSDYAELDKAFSRVGRTFTYQHMRRSENVEDNRTDTQRASDELTIAEFRALLNKHTPTPTIMAVHQ